MSSPPQTKRSKATQFIGLMSGTSLDGIDGVRVQFSNLAPQILQHSFAPYPPHLKRGFKALLDPTENELHRSQELAIERSHLAFEVVQELCHETQVDAIVAIGDHGQTVRHQPNGALPYTLQLGNAAVLAQLSGLCTVTDFRSRDIAAGGQGAPLAPLFHQAVFADPSENRAVVNIGGIANISLLSNDAAQGPIGFDTGPGNALMDEWSALHLDKPYDDGGQWAKSGKVDAALLKAFMSEPFLALAPPKSTGRDLFNLNWLQQFPAVNRLAPADVQASLCEFTALCIASALQRFSNRPPDTVFLSGGGANNLHLVSLLQGHLSATVTTTQALGLDTQAVEACAFAWLAKQAIQGAATPTPSVTGASQATVLGAIYPA